MAKEFTHTVDDRVQMVDTSKKDSVSRQAVASGKIILTEDTINNIQSSSIEKGNVLATARVAAIMAAKKTSDTIPMCHPIPITGIDTDFDINNNYITASVKIKSVGKTGVEMEALNGVSTALLTIWDMVKSAEKDETGNYPHTKIQDIEVIEKTKSESI
ncbi:cyclic pyranopterin monophosphate synthase MoaC [Methanohalobium sp.]|uniref:cyclic pyranopterin monophosphate synthase MoaC n=1 Tax=Methanohalobium sp. TaxID=2837493 RepID=UPI0025F75066|nr:cyclic pyranopterin monophosphate synthase MoaC [Methanohalobium sp.]